jgi:glycerol-3-phosphate cytidylyltransferase
VVFNKVKELKEQGLKIGITASQFDLLHAGHIAMLSEAKNHCDYLICALQNNAKWDRPEKNEPVQTIVERQIQLAAVRYVDEVVIYNSEKDLEDILLTLPIDVRILGVEYMEKEFTGRAICERRNIELVFNGRDHSFSSSNLRKRVYEAERLKLDNNSNL